MKSVISGGTVTLIAAILAGCAANSDGSTTLGAKGSPAWHQFAPPQDIVQYYDQMQTFELCLKWDEAISEPKTDVVRGAIGRALQRRGEDPMRCYDASADAIRQTARKRERVVQVVTPQPQPRRSLSCTSQKIGNFISTNCY